MPLMSSTDTTKMNPAELRGAIQLLYLTLQHASSDFEGAEPPEARARVRNALIGITRLISALYPNETRFFLPLNALLYALHDLDNGKVVPLLAPAKVSNRPTNALADELFKAIPAAAMTCLMEGKAMKRSEASREILKRLRAMNITHHAGEQITANQITKWREKMMTELAAENRAVARYQYMLEYVGGLEPMAAVEFLLNSLADLPPPTIPNNPQA